MTISINDFKHVLKKDIEPNNHGNSVYRGSEHDLDRYYFDFGPCSTANGWIQFDTTSDAHYFGLWINKQTRQIFTYCEGDLTLTEAPTNECFNLEIKYMITFYEKGRAFATLDRSGTFTEHFQDQNIYFIK